MFDIGPVAITHYDAVRLVAIPVFVWGAYTDVKTRRVSNQLWPPLLGLALIALLLEGLDAITTGGAVWQEFVLVVGLSIGLLVPLAYGFWYLGGFGGADAKAIMVLALLFPTVPLYEVGDMVLPVVDPAAGVFSLSILTNAVVVGLVYPLALAGRNLAAGDIARTMFIGRRIRSSTVIEVPGRLIETRSGIDTRGLDLDALRMYLTWRGIDLEELRADPDQYRTTIPEEPVEPGDGAVADGGTTDPWAAEAFLADVSGRAYGTTPEGLRDGLEVLVDQDRVWYTPGIPFILLIVVGLALALVYGDLMTTGMEFIGLA